MNTLCNKAKATCKHIINRGIGTEMTKLTTTTFRIVVRIVNCSIVNNSNTKIIQGHN